MQLNTKMPALLKPFYQSELAKASELFAEKKYQLSWRHLERAHNSGQPYPIAHTAVHWEMFLFGIRLKNRGEVIGQIHRFIVIWQ